MIRLPEPMTVAELKRHMDRRFITKRGLRRELQKYATKEDLKALATKDDLNDLRRTMYALHHETLDLIREFRRDLLYIVDNHERRLNDLDAMHRL